MTNSLWILLKAQYRNQSSFNALRHEKDRKKRARGMGVYAAYGLVFVMMVAYSFLMAYGYGYLGMEEAVPGYSLAICSLIALFFTFLKTNGFLFAFRDYDMVMALPFSTGTVITAKFLYMYISNLMFSMCVMIPMCIGYAVWAHPGVMVYLIWFVSTCFAPLIPMAIASVVGALIAGIGSKFRFKVFVQAALSLILVLAVTSLSFLLNGAGSDAEFLLRMENIGEVLQRQIHKIYPVSVWFDQAVKEENILYTLLFVAVSFAVYLTFVAVVSLKYKEINTALMTSANRSNYRVGRIKEQTILRTLVKKEMKRFTSSVVYLMNMGIGMMLAVVGSAACLVVGADQMLAKMQLGAMQQGFYYAVPFVLATPLTMTCTTCVSWSLEGKNLWILKSLPLEESTIFKGKMAFNLVLLVPAAVFCNICLVLALRPDFILGVLYFLTSFGTIAFSTTVGMWIGKKLANFQWENEVQVIKQSAASMLGIFANMLLEIGLVVASFTLSMVIDGRIVLSVIALVLFGVSGMFYKMLCSSSSHE